MHNLKVHEGDQALCQMVYVPLATDSGSFNQAVLATRPQNHTQLSLTLLQVGFTLLVLRSRQPFP